MRTQIFAAILLAGVVLVSAEKKDEQSVEKKDKRGLFDLGYGHNLEKEVPYFVHEKKHHHEGWSHGHDVDFSHHHY
ncbi:hypothetical protein CBL_01543 [Carabus blaptoides fortunei]